MNKGIKNGRIAIIEEELAKLDDNRPSMPLCYLHDPPSTPTLVIIIIIPQINKGNDILGKTFIQYFVHKTRYEPTHDHFRTCVAFV